MVRRLGNFFEFMQGINGVKYARGCGDNKGG